MHWAGLIDKVMAESDDGDGAGFGFVCAAVEDFAARVMKEDRTARGQICGAISVR